MVTALEIHGMVASQCQNRSKTELSHSKTIATDPFEAPPYLVTSFRARAASVTLVRQAVVAERGQTLETFNDHFNLDKLGGTMGHFG